MSIEVQYRYSMPEVVTVFIDGACAHNVTEQEEVEDEYGFVSKEVFCSNCGAWYNDIDDRWEKQ
jgi:ribosomal protein S27AE